MRMVSNVHQLVIYTMRLACSPQSPFRDPTDGNSGRRNSKQADGPVASRAHRCTIRTFDERRAAARRQPTRPASQLLSIGATRAGPDHPFAPPFGLRGLGKLRPAGRRVGACGHCVDQGHQIFGHGAMKKSDRGRGARPESPTGLGRSRDGVGGRRHDREMRCDVQEPSFQIAHAVPGEPSVRWMMRGDYAMEVPRPFCDEAAH